MLALPFHDCSCNYPIFADLYAPGGNQNTLKHGRYSREVLESRHAMRQLLREADELIEIT